MKPTPGFFVLAVTLGCGSGASPPAASSSVTVTLPAASTGGSRASALAAPARLGGELWLHVALTGAGIVVSGHGGTLAPDCRRHAAGITVPRRADGAHDFVELTRCARELKERSPEQTQVSVTADAKTPYREVVAMLDALRSDAAGELFPEVHFAPASETTPSANASQAPVPPRMPLP